MISTKHKLKINNSYESEPSSGSGSSLGEQQEGPTSDDENIHFPYLMKPNDIRDASMSKFNHVELHKHDDTDTSYTESSDNESRNNSLKQRALKFGRAAHSSQESPFEGFNESPFGSLREQIFTTVQPINIKVQLIATEENKTTEEHRRSPGQIAFPKYYDTIVEENSCNAVDIKLSNEPVIPTVAHSGSSSSHSNDDANPTSELSFNGKIQSLSIARPIAYAINMDTSTNTSQLTESFILKKYSNEKSPDLFGEDDDDDDDEEEGQTVNDTTKLPEEKNDGPTEQLPVVEEVVEEVETLLPDSSTNRSINCPTESSFVDEQTNDCSGIHLTANEDTTDPVTLFRKNCRRERELLRRIRQCLAGVPPPPSLTIPQLDMFDAVLSRKTEILQFVASIDKSVEGQTECSDLKVTKSLFKPTHSELETRAMGWRDVLGVRQMGLSYNLNKASESNEYLSLSVIERFIGAETASSYRNSPSSAKKRNVRLSKLLTQSPGNRLSHLAKRRAIFSSANLATTSLKTSSSIGPQILIDKKKSKHRRKATPKRMTPGSKKKTRKTPSSSARKRLFRVDVIKPGPSRETSKRALFQSPAKQQLQQKSAPPKPVIKPEIANRVEKSKRALFPPETANDSSASSKPAAAANSQYAPTHTPQLDSFLKRKRQCVDDDDDELSSQSSNKLFRGSTENLTPRALKIKSQSFCIGAGSSTAATASTTTSKFHNISKEHSYGLSGSQSFVQSNSSSSTNSFANAFGGGKVLQRAYSEMVAPANTLTENQRKKLLWAVSQALQERKITAKHESFKQYASILARVVRRIFTEYYQKTSTSNSETMLRLAKKYSYHVISGKNLDDIYLQAKSHIDDSKRLSSGRLAGYIGPEEFEQRKQLSQQLQQTQSSCSSQYNGGGSMHNLFATENSIDSFSLSMSASQSSSVFCLNSTAASIAQSQSSFLERISQEMLNNTQSSAAISKSASKQQPILANATLQNSSSKSNLGGLALRENDDRRSSAQKNFTGKDQRNVSPYVVLGASTGVLVGSGRKVQSDFVSSELPPNGGKVKRQITFDS